MDKRNAPKFNFWNIFWKLDLKLKCLLYMPAIVMFSVLINLIQRRNYIKPTAWDEMGEHYEPGLRKHNVSERGQEMKKKLSWWNGLNTFFNGITIKNSKKKHKEHRFPVFWRYQRCTFNVKSFSEKNHSMTICYRHLSVPDQ